MNLEPTVRNNGAPDWKLPPDLGECVAGLMNAVATGIADLVAPHDLIPMEFALLRLFLRREEWTTTQLAQALPVKLSRISRIVTKLVDRGLILRRRLRSDRRVVILTLTEEGRALTLGASPACAGPRRQALRGRDRAGVGSAGRRHIQDHGQPRRAAYPHPQSGRTEHVES